LLGKISYLDISKELRDKIDGKKKMKKHTLNNKCVICDTIFYTDIKHLRKTCSEKCLSIFQKQIGEKYSLLYCGFAANGWKGGIHNYPYCPKFNEDLKTRVRTFFDNKCFNCGKTQTENKKALCVHHVNYNKNACCDETPALFVSLCDSCHGKTNKNREYWENVFEEKLRNEYNYKCYYTQEEYINYKINNI
jgi:predicted nucleic acid-binding Zn ribbon protein